MTIAQAAAASGLPAKTIRYYESIGLLTRPSRRPNRYRCYDTAELQVLRFISRARQLGFPIKSVAELLRLWQQEPRMTGRVKALATEHRAHLDAQIGALSTRRGALSDLIRRCETEDEGAVLDELAR